MPDIAKESRTSPPPSANEHRSDEAVNEQWEKEADEMAGAAQKIEQRYDQDHDIFTK
jgi:hypothetical protein